MLQGQASPQLQDIVIVCSVGVCGGCLSKSRVMRSPLSVVSSSHSPTLSVSMPQHNCTEGVKPRSPRNQTPNMRVKTQASMSSAPEVKQLNSCQMQPTGYHCR
jgi:hypothetical protein